MQDVPHLPAPGPTPALASDEPGLEVGNRAPDEDRRPAGDRGDLRTALYAGCTDLMTCAATPACPQPFADLAR
jgi:hypothetical protein